MGKKLQGAKLRAKKRAAEAVNALQEAQAEAAASSTVVAAKDEQLFVIDSQGDDAATSKLVKNAVATGLFPKKKNKQSHGTPEDSSSSLNKNKKKNKSVDQELVDKLLNHHKHDAHALQRIAQRGREALPWTQPPKRGGSSLLSNPPRKKKRLHTTSKSKVTYDLWHDDDDGGTNNHGAPTKPAPSPAAEAGVTQTKQLDKTVTTGAVPAQPTAGISLGHRPIKARTYRASARSKSSSSSSTADAGADTTSGNINAAAAAVAAAASAEAEMMMIKVEVAKGGQSYHPDPVLHTRQLEVAVTVEMRRNQAEKQRTQPVAQGLSDETKKYLVGDTDDEEEYDEEDKERDDGAAEGGTKTDGATPQVDRKLTTAQRNKQKRQREVQAEMERRKAEKKRNHQWVEIPKYRKELNQKEMKHQERKARIQELKESQKRTPGSNVDVTLSQKDPLRAPTIPVALPSELGRSSDHGTSKETGRVTTDGESGRSASLRTIQPKGSLVLDRVYSMMDRNMAPTRNRKAAAPKKRRIKVQGHVVGPGFEIKG